MRRLQWTRCLPLLSMVSILIFQCTHVILTLSTVGAGEGSGEDSGDEGERPSNEDEDEDDEDDTGTVNSLVHLSHSARTPSSSPFSSPTNVARLQNQRSSLRRPKKISVPMRMKMQSLPKSSQNSSQIRRQNHARSTGALLRQCGSPLSCHRECVSGTRRTTASLRARTRT
jgi:hypothetical protein